MTDNKRDDQTLQDEARVTALAIMPWAVSLLMHAALVLLAVFVIWSVLPGKDEKPIVGTWQSLNQLPQMQTQVSIRQRTTSRTAGGRPTTVPSRMTSQTMAQQSAAMIIGVGQPAATSLGGVGGRDAGMGEGLFTSGDLPRANKPIFLIDASGSLMDMMPFVLQDLKKALRTLEPSQQFTVIFFQDGRAIEAPDRGLKQATPQNIQRVIDWLDPAAGNVVPRGRTSPMAAIELALSYKGDYLVILSDNITGGGRWTIEQEQILTQVRRANVAGTRIDTIQFLEQDPLQRLGLTPTLKLISDTAGGQYKFVDARELYIQ